MSADRYTYACFLAHAQNHFDMGALPEGGHLVHPQYPIGPASHRTTRPLHHSWPRPSSEIFVSRMQEEADTVQLQSLSGLPLTLSLNSRAGRSTSVTLRDALAMNFPAVRDIHQLRAVLIGTPLCEVHGTARTDHHRQGTLFNIMISDERAPSKGPNLPTPSRTEVQGVENTDVLAHTVLDGLLDPEAPPSAARHSSRSSSPEPAAPPPTGPPLSWYGATKLLRERLQGLQRRAQQGPLQHGVAVELRILGS